jgi:hypothetical protein
LSHLARRRNGPKAPRSGGHHTPGSRHHRGHGVALSGSAARRLLDGDDDGPSPLPQLLAAATAPATAAELRGEAAARAAFRYSTHDAPAVLRGPRTARLKTTAAIVTAKIIAAVAITAGTAGGVALATNSYSANLQQSPTGSGTDTASVGGIGLSRTTTPPVIPSTQSADSTARSSRSAGSGDDSTGARDSTLTSPRPQAPSSGVPKRCEARCTTKTTGGLETAPVQQPDQHTDSQAGNGNNAEKKEKKTNNGNGSDKEKGRNNGNQSDNGKQSNGTENPGNNNKTKGDGPGSKQAGVEKGSDKKTDARTTRST